MKKEGFKMVLFSHLLLGTFAVAVHGGLRETSGIREVGKKRVPDSVSGHRPKGRAALRSGSKKKTVVAIVDTGVDTSIPRIAEHLWVNPREIKNGRDDDGNGLIDDINGWDFVEGMGLIRDRHGHGTHVAGIILDQADQIEILPLTYYSEGVSARRTLEGSLRSLSYAIEADVDIINYSGGGTEPNEQERLLLQRARDQGILVVAAAGNDARNTENRRFYPAGYGFSNILSVGAASRSGAPLRNSNYGVSIDVIAVGDGIVSDLPGGERGEMTGTSQATALVSGVAARLMGQVDHTASPEYVIDTLVSIARFDERLRGRSRTSARLIGDEVETRVNSGDAAADRFEEMVNVIAREKGFRWSDLESLGRF